MTLQMDVRTHRRRDRQRYRWTGVSQYPPFFSEKRGDNKNVRVHDKTHNMTCATSEDSD